MATRRGKKQGDNDLDKKNSKEGRRTSTDAVFEKALKSRQEKKAAKGGREDLKDNIDTQKKSTKKKRRRRKPAKQPDSEQSYQKKPEQINVKPINPFVQTSGQGNESYLPPKEHEERYQEELEPADEGDSPAEEENIVDEKKIEQQSEKSLYKKVPTIEKKALEDKPLDRIQVEKPKEPESKEKEPEELEQSEEKISEGHAGVEKTEASEFSGSSAEKAPIEAEAETVEVSSAPVEGHVEPDLDKMLEGVDGQKEEFKEDFLDILRQAGFTPKRIIYALIFIVLGVFMFYYLIKWIVSDDNAVVIEPQEDQSTQEDSESEVPTYVLESSGDNSSGVISSYVFGLEDESQKDGIMTIQEYADESGFEASSQYGYTYEDIEEDFVYYFSILSKIKNLYETDVYNLLDVSSDRRQALEDFLTQMDAAIEEAKTVYNSISEELIELDSHFEEVAVQRDEMEYQFFVNSDDLRGEAALNALEGFIESTKLASEIRAYYNAYKLIRDKFYNYLGVVEPHFEEITINKEAVIKGIRVFDIPGTDETEIIVPVNPE